MRIKDAPPRSARFFGDQGCVEHEPGTVGRYRNCDPLLIGCLFRQEVEALGRSYLAFPRAELYERIGMRHTVLETDPYGNFISTGYEYGTVRDWARLGLLVLRDGVWGWPS